MFGINGTRPSHEAEVFTTVEEEMKLANEHNSC